MSWLFQSIPPGQMFALKARTSFSAALLPDCPFACTVDYSYFVLVFIRLHVLQEKGSQFYQDGLEL